MSPLLYGLMTEEINHIETDILGKDTGDTRVPGPLANPAEKQAWRIDPRV